MSNLSFDMIEKRKHDEVTVDYKRNYSRMALLIFYNVRGLRWQKSSDQASRSYFSIRNSRALNFFYSNAIHNM